MSDLEMFINSLIILKKLSPDVTIDLPRSIRGMPPGTYTIKLLLECIEINLKSKKTLCQTKP